MMFLPAISDGDASQRDEEVVWVVDEPMSQLKADHPELKTRNYTVKADRYRK
jgi:hypothetical protein